MIKTRAERKADHLQVQQIHFRAFGQKEEGEIVNNIRKSEGFVPELSIVAEKGEKVIGHILFSKIHIEKDSRKEETLSLAPMAVLPGFQRKGVGEALINAGIQKAMELGFDSIIVLGHPNYYPKFGFEKASKWKITCSFDVPDEAFMAIELEKGVLEKKAGRVVYPPAFNI